MFDAYEDVVKIEDVCEMLNIGKNKAYSLLTKGELHGFKIGRIWKISKKSVIEYIEHNTKQYQ
ncbi:MAG: helix-turn-helix domain-containing protein [Lachnospiraceae bacterium]|nr:helix-turn-helix domain-containing protein [Lachnospiraceae bacterium]